MKARRCLAVLVLASCATSTDRLPVPSGPDFPTERYLQALGKAAVFRVAPGRSRADVIVRRGGRLESLGHDHVVTARMIDGFVMVANEAAGASQADLVVDLSALSVDEPDARSVYGLSTTPTEKDVAGTTANMNEKVLETTRWPATRVTISAPRARAAPARCEVTVSLKGVSHTLTVDIWLDYDEQRLQARGTFDLKQSDFGIEPFSLLGGALAVRDRLEISFRIEADRVDRIDLSADPAERSPGPAGPRSPHPAG